jgi:type II secretory pathway component PulM
MLWSCACFALLGLALPYFAFVTFCFASLRQLQQPRQQREQTHQQQQEQLRITREFQTTTPNKTAAAAAVVTTSATEQGVTCNGVLFLLGLALLCFALLGLVPL